MKSINKHRKKKLKEVNLFQKTTQYLIKIKISMEETNKEM